MHRQASNALDAWAARPRRHALVVRGARQVGKTWLLRDLGARRFGTTALIDFQLDPGAAEIFERTRASEVIANIEALTETRVTPGSTLLILDEVQEVPRVIERVRLLIEGVPALHIALAGSALDVALRDARVGMPVGRVEFGYVEPMSFGDFLGAVGNAPCVFRST